MPSDLVQQATPVDADKLWRVRVAKELHSERNWTETYGYMVGKGSGKEQAENGGDPLDKTDHKPTVDPFQRSFDSQVMGYSAFARKTTRWI